MDWAEIRQQPPDRLVTLDQNAYNAVLSEATVQGHAMAEWHVHPKDRGQTRYSTCVRCRLSVWIVGGHTTRLQAGLGRVCVCHPAAGSPRAGTDGKDGEG